MELIKYASCRSWYVIFRVIRHHHHPHIKAPPLLLIFDPTHIQSPISHSTHPARFYFLHPAKDTHFMFIHWWRTRSSTSYRVELLMPKSLMPDLQPIHYGVLSRRPKERLIFMLLILMVDNLKFTAMLNPRCWIQSITFWRHWMVGNTFR